MEDYLKELAKCLLKLQPDKKEFISIKILKSDEELIIKQVWSDNEKRKEPKCSLPEALITAEKIQVLSKEFNSNHSIQMLPTDICLRKSGTSENEYGVWSNVELSKGIRFGPYKGIICYDQDNINENNHSQILKDGQIDYFVDSENDCESNWLKYINFASCQERQNLIIMQSDGEIYYQTIKNIHPNTELFVWYQDQVGTEILNNCGTETDVSDVDLYNKRFATYNTPAEDRYLYTKQTYYYCNVCGKRFRTNYFLKYHLCLQSVKDSYRCNLCGKRFIYKSAFEQHLYMHIGKCYNCDECGKTFIQEYSLKAHLLIHAERRSYNCDVCGKTFTQKGSLKYHMLIHTGEKIYSCDECGKKFVQKCNLKAHQLVHTGEKPYNCKVCGKRFARKACLRHHEDIHLEKSLNCDVCGKIFEKKYTLKLHQRVHAGGNSYHCDLCGKKFLYKATFIIHQRVHTGEKPFNCDICGKKFSQKGTVKLHQLTHVRKKYYVCDVCGRKFRLKTRLQSHQHTHTEKDLWK